MLKTYIVIGMYNNLPEGVPEGEFEHIYQTCYRPFLSVLNRFPDIQAVLHFSGSLLKRLELKHPEYLMLLEEMIARRQVEMLGGGFYAPILPLIPASDRLGQIELLTTYLRKSFGKRPRGCWLAEYAWEPWLASTLQTCGMDYTFLTEEQFKAAMGGAGHFEPVVTEDQGRCITVFPTYDCSESFPVPMGFDEAVQAASKKDVDGIAVLMAPGEGIKDLWEASSLESPDIYIERTLAWLRKNALEYETTLPSRYLKQRKPLSRAYFPGTASRAYTRECASIVDSALPASHPSLRNAILRSSASGALYARMYYVHLIIGQLRGDRSRKKTAVEELWRGQCGDAYWRSRSRGMLQPKIREAVYRALIEAEQTTRIKGSFKPGIIRTDTDFDGLKEVIYQGSEISAWIKLRGAAITELDVIKARKNLCDLYNGDADGAKANKSLFVDRVYAKKPADDIAVAPWNGDCASLASALFEEQPTAQPHNCAAFLKDTVVNVGKSSNTLAVHKEYQFHKKTVSLSYQISNKTEAPVEFWLGIEFNLSLDPLAIKRLEIDGMALDKPAAKGGPLATGMRSGRVCAIEPLNSVALHVSSPSDVYVSPVACPVEGGSPIDQGYCVLLLKKLSLDAYGEFGLNLGLSMGD